MARPLKNGLDYFPMDVTMDNKIELIEAKHGIEGFGVLVKLYQEIYKEGYFIEWTEERDLIFSKRINVCNNKVNEVINDSLRYNIFDKNLHKKYKILTSTGIQKRYLAAIDRRKEVELVKDYIIVDINGINANINWINEGNKNQSKVDKNKVTNTWRTNFEIYKQECKQGFKEATQNIEFIQKLELIHTGFDIKKSIFNSYESFWKLEDGWKNKKKSKSKKIDWKATIMKTIKFNLVK